MDHGESECNHGEDSDKDVEVLPMPVVSVVLLDKLAANSLILVVSKCPIEQLLLSESHLSRQLDSFDLDLRLGSLFARPLLHVHRFRAFFDSFEHAHTASENIPLLDRGSLLGPQ